MSVCHAIIWMMMSYLDERCSSRWKRTSNKKETKSFTLGASISWSFVLNSFVFSFRVITQLKRLSWQMIASSSRWWSYHLEMMSYLDKRCSSRWWEMMSYLDERCSSKWITRSEGIICVAYTMVPKGATLPCRCNLVVLGKELDRIIVSEHPLCEIRFPWLW